MRWWFFDASALRAGVEKQISPLRCAPVEMTSSSLLEKGEQGEEEEPEDAHGVPVPRYAIDENLTGFE